MFLPGTCNFSRNYKYVSRLHIVYKVEVKLHVLLLPNLIVIVRVLLKQTTVSQFIHNTQVAEKYVHLEK